MSDYEGYTRQEFRDIEYYTCNVCEAAIYNGEPGMVAHSQDHPRAPMIREVVERQSSILGVSGEPITVVETVEHEPAEENTSVHDPDEL